MILAAVLLVTILVGIPLWRSHGWKGCLLALLAVGGGIALLLGVVALGVWLAQNMNRGGGTMADRAWRGVGHTLRFLAGGFLGMLIAAPLMVSKELSPAWETTGLFTGAVLLGWLSVWLYRRVGAEGYQRICVAFLGVLLVSWVLGLLSLLVPWRYALDVAVLAPLTGYALWVRRPRGL